MIKLVRNQSNKISVDVTATIDYTGFTASLLVVGVEKDLGNLKAGNARIEFSPEEVDLIGDGSAGYVTVRTGAGDVYIVNQVWFAPVNSRDEAVGYQALSIVLVSKIKYEGGKQQTSADIEKMIDEKVDETVDRVMTESIDAKVEEIVDAVIDEKVAEVVDDIVDDKVDKAVDAVIDIKVEEQVNALFESSDSDTIGGQFENMKESVEDLEPRMERVEDQIDNNILPRLSAAETVLAKKISLDYEDSDDHIVFYTGMDDIESAESGE